MLHSAMIAPTRNQWTAAFTLNYSLITSYTSGERFSRSLLMRRLALPPEQGASGCGTGGPGFGGQETREIGKGISPGTWSHLISAHGFGRWDPARGLDRWDPARRIGRWDPARGTMVPRPFVARHNSNLRHWRSKIIITPPCTELSSDYEYGTFNHVPWAR